MWAIRREWCDEGDYNAHGCKADAADPALKQQPPSGGGDWRLVTHI